MKKNLSAFCFLSIILLVTGCGSEQEPGSLVVSKTIMPGTVTETNSINAGGSENESDEEDLIPFIYIDQQRYLIVRLVDVNLDDDGNDEQLVVTKERSSTESPCEILVIKFDNTLKRYEIIWRSTLLCNESRNFSLYLQDLTGDGKLEIICSGLDRDNRETIDIFYRIGEKKSFGYKPIFSVAANGSIDITESVELKKTAGRPDDTSPKLISVTSQVSDSFKYELTREIYEWDASLKNYSMQLKTIIPGKEIADQKLREYLQADFIGIRSYFDGIWIRGMENGEPDYRSMIVFNSLEKSIQLYFNNIQEIFYWGESDTKKTSKYVTITSKNFFLDDIENKFKIEITGINLIKVQVIESNIKSATSNTNSERSGDYFRMNPDNEKYLLNTKNPYYAKEPVHLSGFFQSDSGDEIFFDPPRFSLVRKGEIGRGLFSTYNVGYDVLELRVSNDQGLLAESIIYRIEYTTREDENQIIRTLTAEEGVVGMFGFKKIGEGTIKYNQFESKENRPEVSTAG